MIVVFSTALFLPFLFIAPAYAYLDPGVGSMLLQALAAIAIGVAVFWRNLVLMVKAVFTRGKSGDDGAENAQDARNPAGPKGES